MLKLRCTLIAATICCAALPARALAQVTLLDDAERVAAVFEALEAGTIVPGDEQVETAFEQGVALQRKLEAHLRRYPDDTRALLLSIRLWRFLHFASWDDDDAVAGGRATMLARATHVLALEPANAQAYHQQAWLLAGSLAGGIDLLAEVDDPDELYEAMQQLDAAITAARRAAELVPDSISYRRLLRALLYVHGEFGEAAEVALTMPDAAEWRRITAPLDVFPVPAGGAHSPSASSGFATMIGIAAGMSGSEVPAVPEARVRAFVYDAPARELAARLRTALGDDALFADAPPAGAHTEDWLAEAFDWTERGFVRLDWEEQTDWPPFAVLLIEEAVGDEGTWWHALPATTRDLRARAAGERYTVLVLVSGM